LKKAKWIRWVILGAILIGSMFLSFMHTTGVTGYPSVHALCPLGGLENFWSFLTTGANIQKIFAGTMTLFFFTLVFALIFGRAFCGNLCAFGFLQELLGKISKKKLRVSAKLDKALRQRRIIAN